MSWLPRLAVENMPSLVAVSGQICEPVTNLKDLVVVVVVVVCLPFCLGSKQSIIHRVI